MTTLREAAQQALEAMESADVDPHSSDAVYKAITALRAALEQPVQSGSCIACGNRMTGSPESFVVATAEVGVTAPEGYSPQQVEALHPHKGGDKTAPPLVDRIADCLVEDHIALMRENERLRAALAEPVQEPVQDGKCKHCVDGCPACDARKLPVQEPLTIERLRDALVASRIIPPAAVEDPDEYDDGVTLFRIEALHRRIT